MRALLTLVALALTLPALAPSGLCAAEPSAAAVKVAPAAAPASAAAAAKSSDRVRPEDMEGVSLDGLNDGARKLALDLLHEYGCDCGCGMKLAVCRRDDSKCQRSLGIATQVIAMAKDGKGRDEIVKAALSSPSRFVQFALPAGDAPAVGPADARVTILHYYDYQCPFCVKATPAIEQILREYPNDVRIVFKQHPLAMHPAAPLAHEAALAAHAQGKFLEMHRKIFATPKDLSRERLIASAREIGLDVERFTKELDGKVYAPDVQKHVQQAQGIGATGTPASFVNGRFVSGAKPFEFFKGMIDEELAWARDGNRPTFTTGRNVKDASTQAVKKGPDPAKIYDLPAGDAPAIGPRDARVTILHYIDYQCPVCVNVGPTIDKIAAAYPKDVRVVFKMRPLSIHAQAMIAAEAALAAAAQGKFMEMHTKLFANSRSLSRDKILELAKGLGLDMARFTRELDARTYKPTIDAITREVVAIGATATPTSFINGRFLVGAQPFETFRRLVDEELAKSGAGGAAAGS